jgi:hypothetical protein
MECRFPKGITTAPVLRNLVSALHSAGYIFEQIPLLANLILLSREWTTRKPRRAKR